MYTVKMLCHLTASLTIFFTLFIYFPFSIDRNISIFMFLERKFTTAGLTLQICGVYIFTAQYFMMHLKNGHVSSPISDVFCWLGITTHKSRFKDSVMRKFWSSPHDTRVWIQAVWESISLCSPYWHCAGFGVRGFFFIVLFFLFHYIEALLSSYTDISTQAFMKLFFNIENREMSECTQHSLVQRHCKKDNVKSIDINSQVGGFPQHLSKGNSSVLTWWHSH